ncbi:hypothetical protein [Massilia sp. DWR3-1-1]|uniref:hypothetical protein n=1 Tax=Massilia sp. DWR3-1-1 TaxID=2804559 RepID=UPI003CEB59AA
MSEVRDGYNDPANATTQAEKYGAWVRRQEEVRAQERATPVSVATPTQIDTSDHVNPVSPAQYAHAPVPTAPSSASRTARAGAAMFAVIALVWGYAPQLSAIQLGLYLALGAIVGYAAGWLFHWAMVITGVIVKLAVRIAIWGFLAYIVLLVLGLA